MMNFLKIVLPLKVNFRLRGWLRILFTHFRHTHTPKSPPPPTTDYLSCQNKRSKIITEHVCVKKPLYLATLSIGCPQWKTTKTHAISF